MSDTLNVGDRYRSKFIGCLQTITELMAFPQPQSGFVWTAEYLTRRGLWYTFQCVYRSGSHVVSGYEYELSTGEFRKLHPNIAPSVLFEFQKNALVTAYLGRAEISNQFDLNLRSNTALTLETDHFPMRERMHNRQKPSEKRLASEREYFRNSAKRRYVKRSPWSKRRVKSFDTSTGVIDNVNGEISGRDVEFPSAILARYPNLDAMLADWVKL